MSQPQLYVIAVKQYLYSRFSKALQCVIFCVIFNCYDRQLEHGTTPVFLKTYVRKHQNSTQGLSTYVHFEAPHPYFEKYVEARKKFSIILIWYSPQRSLATSLSLNCTILDCPFVLKIYRNIFHQYFGCRGKKLMTNYWNSIQKLCPYCFLFWDDICAQKEVFIFGV